MINKYIMAMVIVVCSCSDSTNRPVADPFFLNDTPRSGSSNFDNLAQRLKTYRSENTSYSGILHHFNGPLSLHLSFKNPVQKRLANKSFIFNRIIAFKEAKGISESKNSNGREVYKFETLERLYVIFFLHENIINYYIVAHEIREPGGEWMVGPLQFNPEVDRRELWKGQSKDMAIYWMQRADRRRHIGNWEDHANDYGVTAANGYYVVPAD